MCKLPYKALLLLNVYSYVTGSSKYVNMCLTTTLYTDVIDTDHSVVDFLTPQNYSGTSLL